MAGDTNGNGRVEAADALLVMQMAVGKRVESDYPIYLWDMDSDKRPFAFQFSFNPEGTRMTLTF